MEKYGVDRENYSSLSEEEESNGKNMDKVAADKKNPAVKMLKELDEIKEQKKDTKHDTDGKSDS